MRKFGVTVATLLALVALSGCGNTTADGLASDQPTTTAMLTTAETTSATPLATTPRQQPALDRAARSQPSTSPSALDRHDTPPDGVERLVSYPASGDQVCQPTSSPQINFDRRGFAPPGAGETGVFYEGPELAEPEIGEYFVVCVSGFADDAPVSLTVTDPTGATQTKQLTPVAGQQGQILSWNWEPRPGDPLGAYEVVAEQAGGAQAQGTFTVHPPSTANIAALGANSAETASQPGDDVPLMLLGFEPDQIVRLDVYGPMPDGQSGYSTSVERNAGPTGSAIVTLPSSTSDEGSFVVRAITADGGVLDTTFALYP